MEHADKNPYAKLADSAVGTPCKLNDDDIRALFRLEQWMRAYCITRRDGNIPPHAEVTEASAYYMVSFFKQLLLRYGKNNRVFEDVNRCFDKVNLLNLDAPR